jgi:hypothetical protein
MLNLDADLTVVHLQMCCGTEQLPNTCAKQIAHGLINHRNLSTCCRPGNGAKTHSSAVLTGSSETSVFRNFTQVFFTGSTMS